MIKVDYDWGTKPAVQLAELEPSDSVVPQIDGDRKATPDLEVEWAISNARLKEKQRLDERFADIIGMINEPRQLLEPTIAAKFRVNDQDRSTGQH